MKKPRKLKNISKEFYFNMSFNSAWGYTSRLQGEIKWQAAEIEKLEFCLGGALTDIEKLKDSIRALESEQKDYEKTTMRLNKENEELKEENEGLKRLLKEQNYSPGLIQ